MKLTKERALELHKQMWSDMRTALGDDPSAGERVEYKRKWCESHFPNESIYANCFLCEYTNQFVGKGSCRENCPIVWLYGKCDTKYYYYLAPISEILALPEREDA